MPDSVLDVDVAGDYAYVAAWEAGLRVVDVSVPSAPVERGFYDTPGLCAACGRSREVRLRSH